MREQRGFKRAQLAAAGDLAVGKWGSGDITLVPLPRVAVQ